MPAPAPPRGPHLKKILRRLGAQIRRRRKLLKISAVVTAEAAGVSRMTLNRIESGIASVTMGAYLNVISALGLSFELSDGNIVPQERFKLPKTIRPVDYPQLKRLAWQLKGTTELTPEEALHLYERNWRHVEHAKLSAKELQLIEGLLDKLGRSKLLV